MTTRYFTWEEIKASVPKKINDQTVKAQPVYIVIKNKVYNVGQGFLDFHPGGSVALTQLGLDATGAFEGFHAPQAYMQLAQFQVGELDPKEIKPLTEWQKDIQQLRIEAKNMGLYESSKYYYTMKLLQILGMLSTGVAIIAYTPDNFVTMVLSSMVIALCWQQAGWLAHDFLHHQVFKNRQVNNGIGYFLGNVVQGFSVGWWKQKHCTHHGAPNVHMQDPDINTMPLLAWSEHALEMFSDISNDKMAEFMVSYQFILYFPLLSFARFSWAVSSAFWAFTPAKARDFPTLSGIEQAGLFVHYSWYIGSAFYFLSPAYAVSWLVLSQLFCGIFLATVFSLNHNGRPVYSFEECAKMDFYELAIITGRNVEPTKFNNWFTGGLNFQIEHHMFPTVPRNNLPKIAPMVEKLAKKYNIPYHTTTFGQGMKEVVDRLFSISKLAVKKISKEE
ncbi:fatty acid desaturase-domain-containing protein [Gorgonomyces haynaldii]|nr:fatty acid desaturase-domain-containing protein [Gorgonomyces haynaldii]